LSVITLLVGLILIRSCLQLNCYINALCVHYLCLWLGSCVLCRVYRQGYETLFHVVILSNYHHHHQVIVQKAVIFLSKTLLQMEEFHDGEYCARLCYDHLIQPIEPENLALVEAAEMLVGMI
jgi:hypothetical protein